MTRAWYEIRNATSDDAAQIYIYDQIGEDWFGNGVTAKGFLTELQGVTAPRIDLHLNSPGGSVFDGVAIHNALVRHPATVTTYVDGLAASIASVIALAGERVIMARNALFMIHDPSGAVQGTADDMRQMADVLDKIRDTLVATYHDKTGLPHDELAAALKAETWFTADEAAGAGFVDEVGIEQQIAASFDLSGLGFRNAPTQRLSTTVNVTVTPAADPVASDSDVDGAFTTAPSGGASEPCTTRPWTAGVGYYPATIKES